MKYLFLSVFFTQIILASVPKVQRGPSFWVQDAQNTLIDLNADGKPDFLEVRTDAGYKIKWKEKGETFWITYKIVGKKSQRRWLQDAKDGEQFLLEEVNTEILSPGVLKVARQVRIGGTHYQHHEFIQKGGSYDEKLPHRKDDRSRSRRFFDNLALSMGHETESEKKTKQKVVDHERLMNEYWEEEFSIYKGDLCRVDVIKQNADVANLFDDMNDIIDASYDSSKKFIELKDCGNKFEKGPLSNALDVGLNCLNDLGGSARTYAAQLVGIIKNSERLFGKKLTFDCRKDQVEKHLGADLNSAGAAGLSFPQSEEGFPNVVMKPGDCDQPVEGGTGNGQNLFQKSAIAFHEMFHMLGYNHRPGIQDLTQMCTFACFSESAFPVAETKVKKAEYQATKEYAASVCKGEKQAMDSEYFKHFDKLFEINGGTYSTAHKQALMDPSAKTAEVLINSKGQTMHNLLLTLSYIEDSKMRTKEYNNIKSAALTMIDDGQEKIQYFSIGDIEEFRKIAKLDQSGKNIDQAAILIKNKVNEYQVRALKIKDPELKREFMQLVDATQDLWRGICYRHRDSIQIKENCLSLEE